MPARRDVLLDTGPLVAVLDRADQWHAHCVDTWHEVAPRCVTTEAVLTEASHLLGRARRPSLPLELVLLSGVPVVPLEPAGRQHAVRLMGRYANLPMDYADATLVVVADALRLGTVFTLDRRGFTSYRRGDGTPFRMLPERPARP